MSSYDQPRTLPQNPIGIIKDAENAIVRDLAQAAAAVHKHPLANGVPFALVKAGTKVESLLPPMTPQRATGVVKLRDAASFIAYVNRHRMASTVLYATVDPARFLAVINDHLPHVDGSPADDDDSAGYRDWRAEFTIPPSREWTLWHNANRKDMSQESLAEFLEDNLPDVIEPSGDELMKLVLNFEASKSSAFKGALRLDNGSTQVQWVDEVNGNGNAVIPHSIKLRIPVFERGDSYELDARFKYRVGAGKLALRYELIRSHKVLEQAFLQTWDAIAAGTELRPLLGSPE